MFKLLVEGKINPNDIMMTFRLNALSTLLVCPTYQKKQPIFPDFFQKY